MDGPLSGPTASTRATARALTKVDDARVVVLVEGLSDQIAVETAATCRGRDLESERVVVVPIGGAHAIRRFLTRFPPQGTGVRVAGLCDLHEAEVFRRALLETHAARPGTRTAMEDLGFSVCVADLEDELVRAVGGAAAEGLLDAQGDLAAFRSLQSQPAWRGRPLDAQLRRFLGSGAGRKLRYARVLVEEAERRGALPRPLDVLLAAV